MASYWQYGEFERLLRDIAARIQMLKDSKNTKPFALGSVLKIKLKSKFDAD